MKQKFIIILLCICTYFAFITSKSAFGQYFDNMQASKFLDNFSININGGTTLPFTDLNEDFRPYQNDWKIAFGGIIRKQISPIFGVGGQFLMGKLHGTRSNVTSGLNPNRYFSSDFMEVNFHALINLSHLIFGFKENRTVHLYSTIGLGFANWATIQYDLDNDLELARSGYDGNNNKAWMPELSIPIGMGMYFSIGNKIGLTLETSLHRINSDDLDAYVSGKSKKDYFAYASLGFTYNLSLNSNSFHKAGRDESFYDKEAEKLEKYKERQDTKKRREQQKENMKKEQEANINRAKKKRRMPKDDGMPQVVEYDAVFSPSIAPKASLQNPNNLNDTTNIKDEKVLVYDEGKHIISGGQKNTKQMTKSSNIISFKDALKIKSDDYNDFSETERTRSIISSKIQEIPSTGKIYTVQILATRERPAKNINIYQNRYSIHQSIYYAFQNGLYRYSAGIFTNYYDAQSYANTLKRNGLTDAFVATYNNGTRVVN